MEKFTVGVIIGSLSKGSINRKLARALIRLAPEELEFKEINYEKLPLYNHDLDADFPLAASEFKKNLSQVDAVLIVTPEYNRSIPGALKNAIDWASRPKVENAFARKPSAVIGASTGAIGTAIAQQHLRSILAFLDSPQMTFPEGYIQFKPGLVTDEGEVTVDSTREFLRQFMQAFYEFIERVNIALQHQRQRRPTGKPEVKA